MNETCVFCKKNHLPIHPIFDEIIANDNLESEKIIYFMKIIEDELKQNHWNEAFCMISAAINVNKVPKNTIETVFLIALRNIHNCLRNEPELNKIQKIIKNLISQLTKNAMGKITRVKNTKNSNDFDLEIKRLDEIFVKLKDGTNIEPSLKNYIVYRLMSFFEFKSYDTIKKAIDSTNSYYDCKEVDQVSQTHYGEVIIGDASGILEDLDQLVILILENTISRQVDSTIKLNNKIDSKNQPHAKYLKFLNHVIEITSPDLKKYFDENYQGDWFWLIKKLKNERNDIVHNLSDVKYNVKELEFIRDLMKIFFILFPQILVFLTRIIPKMRRDKEMETEIIEYNQALEKEKIIKAKIISNDIFYHKLQKTFDLEKTRQTGTFKGLLPDKSYGFIEIKETNSTLFIHEKNIEGTVNEGDYVEFLVGEGRDGRPEASHMKKVS